MANQQEGMPFIPTEELATTSSVRTARQRLADRATEIIDLFIANAKKAQDAGAYDVTSASLQFLLEHMPATDGDAPLLDPSIDKNKIEATQKPNVRIGIAIPLGGINQPKPLPAAKKVIDITPDEVD